MAGIGRSTRQFIQDLEICNSSGVGFQTNQLYFRDGHRENEHELEDKNFHYKSDDNITLYGVFDGEHGQEAAEFVVQEMPGQILLGQLAEDNTEEQIKSVLRQAFITVERGYLQTIVDPLLVERGISGDYYASDDSQQLEMLNRKITCSATAVVVLIYYGKMYVANIGDCRAQVCIADENGFPQIVELSVIHDLKNQEEIQRLQSLQVDVNRLIQERARIQDASRFMETTRCIGNYLIKGGYKENDFLATAISEPCIVEPEIRSYPIDESTKFLLLLSNGLYKSLVEVAENGNIGGDINSFLAEMVIDEFSAQSTLNGVAQAVVDKIARMHQELPLPRVSKREDMTLLVRNFNCPLRGSRLPSCSSNVCTPTFNGPRVEFDLYSVGTETDSSDSISANPKPPSPEKVKPYVDFSNYYKALEKNPGLQDELLSLLD